ncbi:hypothetical protein DEU56DRAFT_927631 [Suillus clintonianus]|uniref:uncharacterized protein n=1 Tax=Suillus clintonianus TaxID=1904413 RepID=UPI001B87B932|nr:uncharacterized protein DEU56DRAFT_927631 [Suillus clintonianus]KAG2121269.1 hypothetical protein DEU56DRAFT_927631 [Suillus clintonianus]
MHPVLFLPEITTNIFEFLNPFLSGPTGSHEFNPLSLHDLVALAKTCHALSGPALDVLWNNQLCFGPLLMCMPPSVFEVRNSDSEPEDDGTILPGNQLFLRRSIHLVQNPLPSDLLRMLPYARRIKRIGPPAASYRWVLPELFLVPSHVINWLLSAYPLDKFLPQLTHMLCPELVAGTGDVSDISFAPLSRINFTSLEFYPIFDEKVEGWPLLSILVNDLPQLRTIKFEVYVPRHYMRAFYSGVIAPLCLFRNLEHLDLKISGEFSEGPGLSGFQMFPRLQKLKLSSSTKFAGGFLTALHSTVLHTLDLTMEYNPSAGNQPEHLDGHRLFSSLRCLTISSDFYFMMSLIEAVHSSALESLSLTIEGTWPWEKDKPLARALTALISSKRGWGQFLRTITIDRPGAPVVVGGSCGPSRSYILSLEDLLVFSHLQHVTLADLVIPLNPSTLKTLAIGWPDLVEFYLDPVSARELVTATVDVGSLATFARHCPNLSHLRLGIPLDMVELPTLDEETLTILSSRPTRSACMRISVDAYSSPADSKAMAKFLATVYPGREVKIVLAASFCQRDLHKPSNVWYEVVGRLRRLQPSSLEFGPCYRSRFCPVCLGSIILDDTEHWM